MKNRKKMVKLRCVICGQINEEPLTIYDGCSFDGAKIAAYDSGIHWND